MGKKACRYAVNLVVVEIPEGVERIGDYAFDECINLNTVSFPTTLTYIVGGAFFCCSSLENVDLLHTNLQQLGDKAFVGCSKLKSMTIPDSIKTLGHNVFIDCSNLVPASIDISPWEDEDDEPPVDITSEVVAYLRDQQRIAAELTSKLTTDVTAPL
ncbi:hypothetical protein TL16_g08206 [Triparma laevis f. inornata]|uniref:RNA-directed RNA polymerase n=2 Tax=Triparma laevis TaxID=1534972 RepID=A0A9W7AM32_9STRA|nr:hypothetical protein TrLO_g3375 [Triparma laevis f. longispina]GMH79628.1 hypothetical protein TL16_g08206 [Triparma laevis f. inornata]